MRAIDPDTQALLDSGVWIQRALVLFDFPSGLYGFWEDEGVFTWNGVDFVGGASLLDVGALQQSSGVAASSLVLTLRSIPNTDLTPDVLATIDNEAYHFRPVTIYLAFFDAVTRLLASVEIMERYVIDDIVHHEDGATASMDMNLVTRSNDYSKSGTRVRSTEDQREVRTGDKFFARVGTIGDDEIAWSQEPAKKVGEKGRRVRRPNGWED